MDYKSLVLSKCSSISRNVIMARVMKDRCRQLGQRVNTVEEMVRALRNVSPQVGGALQSLYTILTNADDLIQKCTVKGFVNKSKYKTEFSVLDQRIQDSLTVLATVPHMGHSPSTSYAPPARQSVVDNDLDNDLGILVPFALGGAVAPPPQPRVQYEAVVLTDGSNVIVAECITGRFSH